DRNALGDMLADGGVAFGSAPGQKYAGKAGGKQVKAWKLGLAQQGGVVSDGDDMIVVAATDVVGTLPDKTSITYAALVVGVMHMEPESGDHLWETKLVSFAVPQ